MDNFRKKAKAKRQNMWLEINRRQKEIAEQARILLKIQDKALPPISADHHALNKIKAKAERKAKRSKKIKVPRVANNGGFIEFKKPDWNMNIFDMMLGNFVARPKIEDGASAFTDAHHFIHKLEKKGFVRLGAGAFSTVLGKPGKDRVIKVNRRPDGWLDYIHWAMKHGYAGKFAPQVYSHKWIEQKPRHVDFDTKQALGFGVTVMERLNYTLDAMKPQHDLMVVDALLWRAANDNQMAKTMLDMVQPGITKFYVELKGAFGNLDLHGRNAMVRGDKDYVFVDPVSHTSDVSEHLMKTRLRVKGNSLTQAA